MASLREAADKMTNQLEELVGQMREELTEGEVDFEKLGAIADQISERADGIAETFSTVNETLMQRITAVRSGGGEEEGSGESGSGEQEAASRQRGGESGGESQEDESE